MLKIIWSFRSRAVLLLYFERVELTWRDTGCCDKVKDTDVHCLPNVDLQGSRSKQFQEEYESHSNAPDGWVQRMLLTLTIRHFHPLKSHKVHAYTHLGNGSLEKEYGKTNLCLLIEIILASFFTWALKCSLSLSTPRVKALSKVDCRVHPGAR